MVEFRHPAYVLNRGLPSRASVSGAEYAIDEDGYLSIEDETEAGEVMARLERTYGVTYADDGTIESERAPEPPDTSGEDSAAEGSLTDLDGVGEATADELRSAGYESVADVRNADPDTLAADVDGIGDDLAASLTGA